MLNIILVVLKIIGILMLVILGLILTILVLVLLVPIRYQVLVSYHEKLKARVRVSWLMRLLSVFVTYEEKLIYAVKLGGFTVLSSEKQTQALDAVLDASLLDEIPTQTAEKKQSSSELKADTETISTEAKADTETISTEAKPASPPKQSLVTKLQLKYHAARKKAASLYQKADKLLAFLKDPDNQATFKLILRQLKSILKHFLPTKLKADVVLGFDDPATTGQVLSICSFLYLWYGESVSITPVFDESVMESTVDVRGRIRLGTLIALAVRILLNKNFRILLKRWRVNGGILDG